MSTHSTNVRIYYEDTDTGGVVYYANYMKFAERARTELLRNAGFEQAALFDDENIGFVVRKCDMEFLRPARLDDLLTIDTKIVDITRVRVLMEQTIKRGEEVLVTLNVMLAVVNKNMQPTRLPETIREAMLHSSTNAD